MKHLRHQILLASAIALLLFGGGSSLIVHELGHWDLATQQVRLAQERALLDGQFLAALSRSISEYAAYILAGNADYLAEAHMGMATARNTIARIQGIEQQEAALPIIGDQWHANMLPVPAKPLPSGILARQEKLLKLVGEAIAEVEAQKESGIQTPARLLKTLYAHEESSDQLWTDASDVHARSRSESQQTVDQHHRLIIWLILASLAALGLNITALMFFVNRSIVRPLVELADGAAKVTRGDLEPRIEVRYRNEIGQLQGRFNEMVAHLNCQRAEIERLVESLTRARDAAEMASQAKSEFLAKMSHEIRTPMHGVFLTLDLLRDMITDESQRELTDVARQSARTLVDLIDASLDFTRIESGRLKLEFAVFDLHELLRNIAALEGRRAQAKGLRWDLRIADEVPQRVWGDQLRLNQVLRNLLDNAIRFTDFGAIGVTVEVLPAPEGKPDEPGMPLRLRFSVQDTGIGIGSDAVENIFEPFQQADESTTRRYGGSGLGLAIVRQLADLMGGEATVDSLPGVGSRFSFSARFLPDTRQTSREVAPPPARLPLPAGKRVLLVEDNAGNRLVMKRLLTLAGLDVSTAENGREAIDAASRELFDLILMDCCMPETDGFEATREIRALPGFKGQVPIVALTAYALDEGILRSRTAGMDGYLAKPYTEDQLLEVLHHWLGETRPSRRLRVVA